VSSSLFTPYRLGQIQLADRLVTAPMTRNPAAADALPANSMVTRGGRIFLQLMHAARISHPSLQPDGALPVAPSAIRPAGQVFTVEGLQDFIEPRGLETEEVEQVVREFAEAARLAIEEGGFDGVEVHDAKGYLPHQFLAQGSKQRTDRYGGSAGNPSRQQLRGHPRALHGGDLCGRRRRPGSRWAWPTCTSSRRRRPSPRRSAAAGREP
jgi:N-ethylmaleimide reductase